MNLIDDKYLERRPLPFRQLTAFDPDGADTTSPDVATAGTEFLARLIQLFTYDHGQQVAQAVYDVANYREFESSYIGHADIRATNFLVFLPDGNDSATGWQSYAADAAEASMALGRPVDTNVATWLRISGLEHGVARTLSELRRRFLGATIDLAFGPPEGASPMLEITVSDRRDIDEVLDDREKFQDEWWLDQPDRLHRAVTILFA